jgi:teichuronic acid biosynthesis glycosyltransferase TuaC
MNPGHLVAIPSWYKSGRGSGGGYFRDQALALQRAGWRVAMLAPDIYTPRDLRRRQAPAVRGRTFSSDDDGLPTWRRNALVPVPRLPYRNAAVFALCGLRLFGEYRAANGAPDLVQAHGALNAGVAALAIRRRYGVPFILTEHSTAFAQGGLRWWERDLVRRVIAGAERCLAVSPQLARLLEAQYPGSTWSYLPNPLGDVFTADTAGVAMPRNPAAPFAFVCVARLSPEKGHARLIEAFAEAFHGDPNTRLRLVGEGPIREGLERLCIARDIVGQVDFLGLLPAAGVRDQLLAADAFVLASDVETFGVVVIEALACGRPVVVTASGGPDHLVTAANGLLLPAGDPSALREALRDMRRRAAAYDRAAIRAEALRLYGPEAFARRFAEAIGEPSGAARQRPIRLFSDLRSR